MRVLAADIWRALGGGAHLRRLRRTSIGPFSVEEARSVEALGPEVVLPPVEVMRGYPTTAVDDAVAGAVRHGKVLATEALGVEGEGPWAIVTVAGELLAVYEDHGEGRVKPAVVVV